MRKELLLPFGIGIAVIAIAVAGVFYVQRGAHIELKGSILKVRTQALDENSTAVVVDFRFANPSDYPFAVRSVEVTIDDNQGHTYEGTPVAEVDAKRLFEYYKFLGPKYNDSLLPRDRIPAHQSVDRMIAVRFDGPVALIDGRKNLKVKVEEVDGAVSEISEH